MMCSALERFEEEHSFKFNKVTKIALEGDGTIGHKVTRSVSPFLIPHRFSHAFGQGPRALIEQSGMDG